MRVSGSCCHHCHIGASDSIGGEVVVGCYDIDSGCDSGDGDDSSDGGGQ